MLFERRRKRVKPVNVAHEIFERFGGDDVFDAQRNYDHTFVYGALDFFANLRRIIGIF